MGDFLLLLESISINLLEKDSLQRFANQSVNRQKLEKGTVFVLYRVKVCKKGKHFPEIFIYEYYYISRIRSLECYSGLILLSNPIQATGFI